MAMFDGGFPRVIEAVTARVRRLDPNDDPTAEPLSLTAVVVLFVFSVISAWMFLRWKIQPMQDEGHHLAMTAVVVDYGRKASLYPALYKPFDPINTNSLLYTVAGLLGKIIKPSWAFRISVASYLVGVPFANLWSLRVFGRSAWGAVIAVPLAYNLSYVFGFVNFLFAAPLAILAVPLFYRMFVKPTRWRVLASVVCVTLLFLAHVHVFLWTGVILCAMTLVGLVVLVGRYAQGRPGPSMSKMILTALVAVAPGLALFGRWLWKAKHPADDDYVFFLVQGADWASFVAALKSPSQLVSDLTIYLDLVRTQHDHQFFIALAIVWGILVSVGRLHKWRRPPAMEFACVLTLASYFFLPEDAAGQAVIGSRQIGFGLWFASAFFAPVPARVSALGRWFAIAAGISLTVFHLHYWHDALVKFQREEVHGLEEVLAAAPPRLRMHYVNIGPKSSTFTLNTFWHDEKWYMLDKFGQCNENPAYGAMNSIHYRKQTIHRVTYHQNDWPRVDEIWDNFDLVLTHHWKPSAADLERAKKRGERIAKEGEWELWRVKRF